MGFHLPLSDFPRLVRDRLGIHPEMSPPVTRWRLQPCVLAAFCVFITANVDSAFSQKAPGPVGPSTASSNALVAASLSKLIAPVPAAAFPNTNGNKFISGLGAFHAVFTVGTDIKYSKSPDGITWSAPVTVAGNASHPTIALAGKTLGIAFVTGGGGIQYISKTHPATAWTGPVTINNIGVSHDLSMVSYQSRMHMVYIADNVVSYVNFSPTITVAPAANAREVVNLIAMCSGYSSSYSLPSIAVSAISATDAQARVQVGYFGSLQVTDPNTSCVSESFGFEVRERTNGPSSWTTTLSNFGPMSGNGSGLSMSMAAMPTTGDFYVALSYAQPGSAETQLFHQKAWTSSSWVGYSVVSRKAHIDVEADCDRFRIAVSDFTQGSGGYGPTWYRTGKWTGPAPVWEEPANMMVSNAGANPQALILTTHTGMVKSGTTHFLNASFDESSGTTVPAYSIRQYERTVNGPFFVTPCGPAKTTTNPKAF
jgi:hypothetical protein